MEIAVTASQKVDILDPVFKLWLKEELMK